MLLEENSSKLKKHGCSGRGKLDTCIKGDIEKSKRNIYALIF